MLLFGCLHFEGFKRCCCTAAKDGFRGHLYAFFFVVLACTTPIGGEDKRGVIVAFGGVVFGVEIATSCSYGRGFLLSDRLKAISR